MDLSIFPGQIILDVNVSGLENVVQRNANFNSKVYEGLIVYDADNDEPVASIAAARPGVEVKAPAKSPVTVAASISNSHPHRKETRPADPISIVVNTANCLPLLLKESKKPGPAWIPIVKINKIIPKFCRSDGIRIPKWPNNNAIKITAETSNDTPLILIDPSM